jgi:hypothetical protein
MFYRHFVGQPLKTTYIYVRASFKILRLFCPSLESRSYTYWYVRQVTVTAQNNPSLWRSRVLPILQSLLQPQSIKSILHSLLHPQSLTTYSSLVIASTITHNLLFIRYCNHKPWQSILHSLLPLQSLTIYSSFFIAVTNIDIYSLFVIAATITHNLFFIRNCSHNHSQYILHSNLQPQPLKI